MLKFFIFALSAVFISWVQAHPLDDTIDMKALWEAPGLKRLLSEDVQRKAHATKLMWDMVNRMTDPKPEKTAADVLEGVRQRLSAEQKILQKVAAGVSAHRAVAPFNLKSDKMLWQLKQLLGQGEVLGGTSLLTEENIGRLCQGNLILVDNGQEFDLANTELPALLEKAPARPNFWGTTRGTQAEILLTFTAAELLNTTTLNETFERVALDSVHSSLVHLVPMPKEVIETVPEAATSFFHHEVEGVPYHHTVHTGFIFGGCTGQGLYGAGKSLLGPWDCSSYVESMCGGANTPTGTLYHLMYALSVLDPDAYDARAASYNSPAVRADFDANNERLAQMFSVVPLQELQLGDVLGWRREGKGGHVGFFAGHTKDKSGFAIMGTNRGLTADMREGVGLEITDHTPQNPQEGFEYYVLRPKAS